MQSLSFDRAVPFYDQTRTLPPDKAELLTGRLLDLSRLDEPGRRGIEVGVGSGRISLPLLARGAHLVGLDTSAGMLGLLRGKSPAAPVVQGEAAALPFPPESFDAALMVHVLHVIGQWQQALLEVQRILRPGGVLLHVWNERDPDEAYMRMRRRFGELTAAKGESAERPGAPERQTIRFFWEKQGWSLEIVDVATWQEQIAPVKVLEKLGERMWSSTWAISDAVLWPAIAELEEWAKREIGDLQTPQPHTHHLRIDVVRPRRS